MAMKIDVTKTILRARSLGEQVSEARTVLIGLRAQRAARDAEVAKLDKSISEAEGQRATLIALIARIDEAIEALSSSLGDHEPFAEIGIKPPDIKPPDIKRTRGAQPSPSSVSFRQKLVESFVDGARDVSALRRLFPDVSANAVAAGVSELVRIGKLVRTGTVKKYVYALPAGASKAAGASVAAPRAKATVPNSATVRGGVLAACLDGPKRMSDFRKALPNANENTIHSAANYLVMNGTLVRAGESMHYVYAMPSHAKIAAGMIAEAKANEAANGVPVPAPTPPSGKSAKRAVKRGPGPWKGAKQAPRGSRVAAVLEVCKGGPMAFGEIARLLPDVNRMVLSTTVGTLKKTGRLRQTGVRGSHMYTTAAR